METSPLALYPKPLNQPRKPVAQPAPKFGGIVDGFSNLVGYIDSNRMVELMASDGIGMILPRSVTAFSQRGVDDGRETFLREFTGLIGNVLITGWFGYGMLKMLGNRVNGYNPHGIPLDAHIHAGNLEAFSKLYHQALTEKKDPGKAREAFIHKFLENIQSSNRQFILPTKLDSSYQIQDFSQRTRFFRAFIDESIAPKQLDNYRNLKESTLAKDLEKQTGKLSETARNELAEYFQPKTAALAEKLKLSDAGTLALHEAADTRLSEQMGRDPALKEKLENNPANRRREASKIRLALYKDTKESTKAFVEAVDKKALSLGLTGTIDLLNPQATSKKNALLSSGQSRKNTLQELKYFLEHYVDRATYDVKPDFNQLKEANPKLSQTELNRRQVNLIEKRLFNTADASLLGKWLPKVEDGLVTTAIKHKKALTAVPIALSILAAGAFTFYNQHITTQKHGGKMFFPGEGNPEASQGSFQPPIPQAWGTIATQNFRPALRYAPTPAPLGNSNGGILA